MSWVSFREKNVPPAGAIFGYASQPGMTVACTNPARPGSTGWEPLDSYWNARLHSAVAGRADRLVERRRAADPVPAHRRAGFGALRQRRAARLSVGPHQRRPQGQAHRPDRRRGRHARHVPPRLGHAPRRHGDRAGRSHPARSKSSAARRSGRQVSGDPLDTPYRGGFVGPRASFRADRLFRGHRHRRHRLLRQLSEVHGARAVGHDPRRRRRPGRGASRSGRGAYAVAEVAIRYRQARARLGDDLLVVSTVERSAPLRSTFISESCAETELLADARVTAAFLDRRGRPQRQPKDWVAAVQCHCRAREMMRLLVQTVDCALAAQCAGRGPCPEQPAPTVIAVPQFADARECHDRRPARPGRSPGRSPS